LGKGYTGKQRRVLQRELSYGEEDLFVFGGPTWCCFSIKAIYLEPTPDLTTDKFLADFARFVSRKGCPRQFQSDNGKTFVGASTVLSRDFLQAVKESVTDAYSQ